MLQLLLLFALFVAGHTQDINQRLAIPPPPVKGFNLEALFHNSSLNEALLPGGKVREAVIKHDESKLFQRTQSLHDRHKGFGPQINASFIDGLQINVKNTMIAVNNHYCNKFLGPWFVQFRKAPCSWSGSSSFTNYQQAIIPTGKGYLLNTLTFRSHEICNTVTGKLLIDGPGILNHIDTIGGPCTGRLTVAATDYKNFVIYWACTKMAVSGNRCDDPMISVATRQRFPSPIVINVVETILRARWGITIRELQRVPHTAPCQQTVPMKC